MYMGYIRLGLKLFFAYWMVWKGAGSEILLAINFELSYLYLYVRTELYTIVQDKIQVYIMYMYNNIPLLCSSIWIGCWTIIQIQHNGSTCLLHITGPGSVCLFGIICVFHCLWYIVFTVLLCKLCFSLSQENSQFVAQVKELESFNNDLRQTCRKVSGHVCYSHIPIVVLYRLLYHHEVIVTVFFMAF